MRHRDLRPRADQIRCTVAGLTPPASAIDRQLQYVSPSGLAFCGNPTISSIFSEVILGLRPLPGRTRPIVATPSSPKRSRHATTLAGETSNRPAIAVEAKPSAANNNAFARITSRCAAVPHLTEHSSISRWPSDIIKAGLGARTATSYTTTIYLRDAPMAYSNFNSAMTRIFSFPEVFRDWWRHEKSLGSKGWRPFSICRSVIISPATIAGSASHPTSAGRKDVVECRSRAKCHQTAPSMMVAPTPLVTNSRQLVRGLA